MVKNFVKIVLVMGCSLTLVNCNKSKSKDNNATSTQCFQDPYTGGCDNSQYNTYSGYGYQPYPIGQNGIYGSVGGYDAYGVYRYQSNSSQLCSCPSGSRPVYNGNMGLGCAPQTIVNYSRTYYWSWSAQSTNNNQYVN
jgi:hypothetical protein